MSLKRTDPFHVACSPSLKNRMRYISSSVTVLLYISFLLYKIFGKKLFLNHIQYFNNINEKFGINLVVKPVELI